MSAGLSGTGSRLAQLRAAAVFALALLTPWPGCQGDGPSPQAPNLVLVVIDSLRADRLGAYGHPGDTSPFMDSLGAEGLVFENAITQAPWTLPSIASLFTSRYPMQVNRSYIDAYQLSLHLDFPVLAELLAEAGYCTMSIAANPYILPVFNLTRGFALREWAYNAPADRVPLMRSSRGSRPGTRSASARSLPQLQGR